jgi:hypothetical protein
MRLWRRRPRWSVVIAAPAGPDGHRWGDTWFAEDLVAALRRAGQQARVLRRTQVAQSDDDDVVLVLRGLRRFARRPGAGTWLLWVISHPELVEVDEVAEYDGVFAASAHWSRAATLGAQPLLQATDPQRFRPGAGSPGSGDDVLFVGSTRGEFRPAVRDAREAGFRPSVYGVGWESFLPAEEIAGSFIEHDDLPAAYASAGVVLNDHWADMAAEGFLSNRLFDAAATGTRVASDPAAGMADVFGDVVRTFTDAPGLGALLADPIASFAPDDVRLDLAARIAREHSFDVRARDLVAWADQVRR